MNEIEKLKQQIEWMQELLIALVVLQAPLTKIKLRRSYPKLDELLTRMNSKY